MQKRAGKKGLVLSRRIGERILIGDDVEVVVDRVNSSTVRIRVVAPDAVRIIRGELKGSENENNARVR